ncbi:hypothetical protein MMC10_004182 [Thelotrema lepadinum]|nr:hypothetical protein [Thelotrema lepadinum]
MSTSDLTSTANVFVPPSPTTQLTSPSTSSGGSGALKPKRTRDIDDTDTVLKRQRNTTAARKYRQKRLDRINELEEALQDMTRQRDDLRLQLARQEAETAALKAWMPSTRPR